MSHLDNFLKFLLIVIFILKKMILKNKEPFKKEPSIWAREDGLGTWKKKKRA
jgi:hypothetical protein